jgi:Icc-related predicted phosphoesterase
LALSTHCFFASDLHGHLDRYEKLFAAIDAERPPAVFLGGDLLPGPYLGHHPGGGESFVTEFLAPEFARLRGALGADYPRIFLVLGNDDPRSEEAAVLAGAAQGIWDYAHLRRIAFGAFMVCGYACIPPSPFLHKDWERWDVSRHLEPGTISPEDGWRTVPADPADVKYGTIAQDLARFDGVGDDLARTIFLCHCPPHGTPLDRAALDHRQIDHVPLDVHIGSIAVRRFIEARQPHVALHGHVHESARLTGAWMTQIGRTICFSAAHDGPELALVRFPAESPGAAVRHLL